MNLGKMKRCVNSMGFKTPALIRKTGVDSELGKNGQGNVILKQEHPNSIKGRILNLVENKVE